MAFGTERANYFSFYFDGIRTQDRPPGSTQKLYQNLNSSKKSVEKNCSHFSFFCCWNHFFAVVVAVVVIVVVVVVAFDNKSLKLGKD